MRFYTARVNSTAPRHRREPITTAVAPKLPRNQCLSQRLAILDRSAKIESTVRYLGIEIDDAIEIAEKIEV
jgi:hypothetical protein